MKTSEWRVLVIEDETDSTEVVMEMLQFQGIQAWSVPNAEDALNVIDQVQPNLFIVDLALPGMDGWAFLRALHNNAATAAIPAVAVTAFHSPTVAREAISAGFRAYFPKPIDTTSFVRQLSTILQS